MQGVFRGTHVRASRNGTDPVSRLEGHQREYTKDHPEDPPATECEREETKDHPEDPPATECEEQGKEVEPLQQIPTVRPPPPEWTRPPRENGGR